MKTIEKFVLNTVGDKAAMYLTSKCDKSLLPHYLLLYWLTNNARQTFNGKIPGIDNSSLTLSRNDNGKYDGHLIIDDIDLDFCNNSILDISATIAVCLDLDSTELTNLNKDTTQLINSLILGYKKQFDSNTFKLKLKPSELHVKCEICQNALFKNGKFKGCFCFSSQGAKTYTKSGFTIIEFERTEWQREDIAALLQMIKK